MKSHGKLEIVQLLRAIAVLFVVGSHIAHQLIRLVSEENFQINDKRLPGDFGVDLFFVISGFIMVFSCWDKFNKPKAVRNFFRSRIIRIVPLYWLMTSLMIAVVLLLPGSLNAASSDWKHFLSSYFFIPFERQSDGLVRPILGVGWSLQFEMYFYLLFGLALFATRKIGLALLPSLFLVTIIAGYLLGMPSTLFHFISNPILIEFIGGVLLGIAFMSRLEIPNKFGLLFIICGIGILLLAPNYNEAIDTSRYIYYGIPAVLVLASATLTPFGKSSKVPKPFFSVGEASYAIYLCHPFIVGIVAVVFLFFGLPAAFDPYTLIFSYSILVTAGSLIAGLLVHHFVDIPFTRWIGKKWKKGEVPSQPNTIVSHGQVTGVR